MTMNLSSVLELEGDVPREVVSRLTMTASGRHHDAAQRMIEGIESVRSQKSLFRFSRHGTVYFESGWRVVVRLSEPAFEGAGFYIYGALLASVLEHLSPLNVPFEVVLETVQSGEVGRWKTQES